MSSQDDTIVLTDLPRGLVIRIVTDYSNSPQTQPKSQNSTSQTKSPAQTVRDIAHRVEETLKHTRPVQGALGATSRFEEILNRAKPIEIAPEDRTSFQVTQDKHESQIVRRRVNEGDCLPEHLAQLKPFHIYHNDDGSLELYWLVNNRLQRVG